MYGEECLVNHKQFSFDGILEKSTCYTWQKNCFCAKRQNRKIRKKVGEMVSDFSSFLRYIGTKKKQGGRFHEKKFCSSNYDFDAVRRYGA